MPKYSKRSMERLKTCNMKLQMIFLRVVEFFDNTIIYGRRGKILQNKLYREKLSQKQYPDSKHNSPPDEDGNETFDLVNAVDAVPYPVDWRNIPRFIYFAGFVMGVAFTLGIGLRWGGDWNQNTKLQDENFRDYGHFELTEKEIAKGD